METNLSTSPSNPATNVTNDQRLTSLWLFVIGVLLVEMTMRILPEGFMTRTIQHRAEEIRYLPPTDIQLMGDSATSGLRVGLLEKFIGHGYQVSNYALPGTAPMFNYFVLRRQIAARKAPKIIVLAPHPYVWGNAMLDRFLGRFATPAESLSVLRDGVKFSNWFYGTLCRFSYILRYREEFYETITDCNIAFFRYLDHPISSVQNTRAKVTVADQQPPVPTVSKINSRNLPPILRAPIAIDPYNELYLDKLCELARPHKIQVIWLSLPVPELLLGNDDHAQRTAAFSAFLERMTARHQNFHAISAAVPTMPDTYFSDAWHLNPYGAWMFSQTAGQQLARWLDAHPLFSNPPQNRARLR